MSHLVSLLNYEQYENLEIVNRGVNLIIDDVAEIPATVNRVATNGLWYSTRTCRSLNKEPNLSDISSQA